GWDTYYLGANVPAESVLEAIETQRADVVGISATMVAHVDAVRRLVQGIRDDARGKSARILVGGYPFNLAGSLWQAVGADGSAPDARAAVAAAEHLL
ncbi:MAG: cobalamin B12-binding domain-containing protein, partial [Rhodocyclaceae bacterium]|nr:cobalamin B12-binding domain-containing protein [Rhodocyclaceae bacterium]